MLLFMKYFISYLSILQMPICFALLSPSCYPWMEAWLTGQCAWREELYVHVYNGCQGKCVNEESLQGMCHNVEQFNSTCVT